MRHRFPFDREVVAVHSSARRARPLLLALTAACGTSDALPRWQATVDTVGDTITVRTMAGSVWEAERMLVPEVEPQRVVARTENSASSSSVPFSPGIAWTFSPHGHFVGGLSTEYRIDLFRTDGSVLRIERAWDPVPVDPDEKADAEDRITTNMRNNQPGWRWNGPATPDTKPPFQNIYAGEEGRLWVQLSQPAVEILDEVEAEQDVQARQQGQPQRNRPVRFREPVVFDVFEPDGTYLGRVRTPDGFAINPQPIFRGDLVWAVRRDELDVPQIVRFRLVPAGSAEIAASAER